MSPASPASPARALPSATRQARALLGLRWQMVRTPGVKLAAVLVLCLLLLLVQGALTSAASLEPAALQTAVALAPEAFLGFGALALIAPLTAGGGTQVVPPEQLVAFPVRASTHFVGGLVLAPANLVWAAQLLVLTAMTAYLTLPGGTALGLLTAAAYVLLTTVVGQALAWTLTGVRATRAGRRAVLGLGLAAAVAVVAVVRSGRGGEVLDASPTLYVVQGVVAAGTGDLARWGTTTAVLLAGAVAGLALGARACSWALTRPADTGGRAESVGVRRRSARRGVLAELVAVDRASVWRAPALRRGGLVLAVLPGVAAAGAQVPWESLVVLPGLVASGAGLLFGVNAFSLDGPGALWLASLPLRPRAALAAKVVVLAETVLGAVLLSLVVGSLRSPGAPEPAVAVAIACGVVGSTALVLAGCLSLSVRHPHRADLRGPRDAVAPPGALVVASVRLALPSAVLGILLEGLAATGVVWLPLTLAVPVLAVSALVAVRAVRAWDEPLVRARVVQTVASG